MSREELNHSERWDEFKANFARMTQEGWQNARVAYLGDLMIPSIRFENDRHVVEFVTSLGDFLEEEEQSYIDKAEFDIYKGIDNGETSFDSTIQNTILTDFLLTGFEPLKITLKFRGNASKTFFSSIMMFLPWCSVRK